MHRTALSLLLFLFITCSSPPDHNPLSKLELQILDSIHSHEGEFAVAFKMMDSAGQTIVFNKNTIFHAASTMKTPVMIEAFRQIENGRLSLDDSLLVTNEFRSIVDSSRYELRLTDDSEPELYGAVGRQRSVRELIELMITRSSNLASNILIDHLGASNISQTMDDLGASGMKVLRGVEDDKAFELGLSNTTDAYSLLVLYEKLARHELVSQQASQAMIEILKRQHFNDVIPDLLPEYVVVAHKTGSITGVRHDSGIVFLPDGRSYVLVLLSKDLQDAEAGTRLLQHISRLVYDYAEELID
jgi:beta-lactamase class A